MRGTTANRIGAATAAILAAALFAVPVSADHGPAHIELQDSTQGCQGVLPSSGGNTQMRVIGGTMTPGGTAIFEIDYPLDASDVGKEFTILDCAYINDVATLKYIISFVPSNESFVIRITLAVPTDAPVGGLYCNYVKTTAAPTAAQASQRKAGPACFRIRPPQVPGPAQPASPSEPPNEGSTSAPILLPDTAMPGPSASAP